MPDGRRGGDAGADRTSRACPGGARRRFAAAFRAPRLLRETRGQATVEFALVVAALMVVVVACGSLWRLVESGVFVEHALSAASHHIGGAIGAVADVFSY